MIKSIGSKQLGFGLVSLPVKLYTAVRPLDVTFNQITTEGNRTAQHLVDAVTGEAVDRSALRKGVEYAKGRYVAIHPDVVKGLNPEDDGRIEIEQFVDVKEIDPIHFDKTYYLGPDKGGERAYGLLAAALTKTSKVGIAKVVLRERQHLVAIRAKGKVLTLTTLYYADEIVDPEDLDLPAPASSDKPLVAEAVALVNSRTARFNVVEHHDEYRERLLNLIDREVAEATAGQGAQEQKQDIQSLLAASVRAAKSA